jgi:ATP-dependent exoDNAse (exonuclease V) beta subunit
MVREQSEKKTDDGEQSVDASHVVTRASAVPADAAREEAVTLGQLVHAALEVLPIGGPADVGALVARYADTVLSVSTECYGYRQLVIERAEEFVARVAASPRFRSLAGANHVAREVDFVLPWPPGAPREAARPAAGDYLIQGVIDCLYQDATGNWHIMDYKTNRIGTRKLADVASAYELQLQVYALAIEQALGVSPRELVLWFLDVDEEYPVAWSDDVRARCIDIVSMAIDQLIANLREPCEVAS